MNKTSTAAIATPDRVRRPNRILKWVTRHVTEIMIAASILSIAAACIWGGPHDKCLVECGDYSEAKDFHCRYVDPARISFGSVTLTNPQCSLTDLNP